MNVSYLAPPNTPPTITFSDVVINGISNVVPDPMTVDGDTVTATARFSSYSSSVAPQPITITGSFVLTQQCCPANDDFSACAGPAQPFTGSGTFTASIVSSTVNASVLLTGDDELVANVHAALSAQSTLDSLGALIAQTIASLFTASLAGARR